ncbi:complex I intermediate-associated protein 30-domain-containing protein [Podospora appendiculata]|uniref:Complex I intermediate-associated protein 30-domain-containing protein n=1 Tax=Podospora appendiculata TaxID=314037 RepID=A0AAE0XFD8_9PEZI|nr:complex I intermediate-associated protein 30-domain-containing protein [Podospora appendiculata]
MPAAGHSMVLFGGDGSPWTPTDWTSSDDSVRGGKSRSTLTITTSPPIAIFAGTLDITALGGAGFASQRTVDAHAGFDLSGHDALVVAVHGSARDGKVFTLVLKDAATVRRPDGRQQSSVSWEHDFTYPAVHDGLGGRVVLRFADFKPTYRGKPVGDAEPLDWSSVRRVGITVRSFFGQQEGDFVLPICSITATKHHSKAESTTTTTASSVRKGPRETEAEVEVGAAPGSSSSSSSSRGCLGFISQLWRPKPQA